MALISAAILAFTYIALSSLYVWYSSDIAAALAREIPDLRAVEQFKGVLFMFVSGGALFGFAWYALHQIEAKTQQVLERDRALMVANQREVAGMAALAVAHDLNNVLSIISMLIELLRESDLSSSQQEVQTRLQSEVHRLGLMVKRLQQLGRPVDASPPELINLGAAVEEAIGSVRRSPRASGATIEFLHDGGTYVHASDVLLHQMLLNLVLNASEAAGKDGRIEVRLSSTREHATIEIHDDGPGVPESLRAKLGEPFYTTKASGLGLGLFSVQHGVRQVGGRLTWEPSPLGGACFRLVLPRDTSRAGPV